MGVPVLVGEQCMIGTGYFPAGRGQTYITQHGSALVGTRPLASRCDRPDHLAPRIVAGRRRDACGLEESHLWLPSGLPTEVHGNGENPALARTIMTRTRLWP